MTELTTSPQGPSGTPVDVQVTGDETPDVAAYAERRVRELFEETRLPVLHARIRIIRHGNPARAQPVVAQGNLDVNGRVVRAQVRARTAQEAVDMLRDRLRRRLRSVLQRPGDTVALGTWRDSAEEPEMRQAEEAVLLPAEDREIVRRKTVTLLRQDLDDAAAFLEDMGYDFHLFAEASTGQDSVLYRSGSGNYRLAQLDPRPDALPKPQSVAVTVSEQGAARLSVAEAVQRIAVWTQPFLFFEDTENDRGAVLYLRHDGHYGHISPDRPGPSHPAQTTRK
jgi:hypothetical protein